jgi:hypothetical protein
LDALTPICHFGETLRVALGLWPLQIAYEQ